MFCFSVIRVVLFVWCYLFVCGVYLCLFCGMCCRLLCPWGLFSLFNVLPPARGDACVQVLNGNAKCWCLRVLRSVKL